VNGFSVNLSDLAGLAKSSEAARAGLQRLQTVVATRATIPAGTLGSTPASAGLHHALQELVTVSDEVSASFAAHFGDLGVSVDQVRTAYLEHDVTYAEGYRALQPDRTSA
jgi:hypothetical protein